MSGSTYRAAQVAEHIGVSRATFYKMLKDGRFSIPSIEGTKPSRWRIADVEQVWGVRK